MDYVLSDDGGSVDCIPCAPNMPIEVSRSPIYDDKVWVVFSK